MRTVRVWRLLAESSARTGLQTVLCLALVSFMLLVLAPPEPGPSRWHSEVPPASALPPVLLWGESPVRHALECNSIGVGCCPAPRASAIVVETRLPIGTAKSGYTRLAKAPWRAWPPSGGPFDESDLMK